MLFRSGVSLIRPILRLPMLALLPLSLCIGGCDREKGAGEQAASGEANIGARQGDVPPGINIDRTHRGKMASNARFTGPDDAAVTLADFRGRPVLLNLWATWCAPCIKEMPSLDHLAAERGDRLTVLAVAQDIQGAAMVDPWYQQAGLKSLAAYIDPANHLLGDYNSALPVTILFDAEGREVWRITGALDWQGAAARALLEEAG